MKLSIFMAICQIVFCIYFMIDCDCMQGGNRLICFMHYMKFIQCLMQISRWYSNIKDKVASNAMSSFNTYLVLFFYFGFLFYNYSLINDFDRQCLFILGAYPASDLFMMIISIIAMSFVKRARS